jgi:poly(3-hydroxybutyrate) depolymerase
VSLDETVTWQVTVPESYEPENPPGVLVYISPSNSGKLPRSWQNLPEAHNLIWIAADHSGNRIKVTHRMSYTIFSIVLIGDRYAIDSSRIYLSGFSGGARVAGLVAAAYPQVFKGDIYIGGAETWEGELAPDKLAAMQRNRYVFLAGSDDFNRRMVRNVAADYTAAGIENVELVIIARLGHELPSGSTMSDALNFLDGESQQ